MRKILIGLCIAWIIALNCGKMMQMANFGAIRIEFLNEKNGNYLRLSSQNIQINQKK